MSTEIPNEEQDLYSILNLSTNAKDEDIKDSYRRLCIIFHPDKHLEESKKSAAQLIFNRIHTAYTVLSEPKLRAIYDEFGMEGVEAAWKVSTFVNEDIQKLKDEIQSQLRTKLLGLWNTKTIISSNIDATMLTEDWGPIKDQLTWNDYLPVLNGLSITQKMEGILTDTITGFTSFSSATKNGAGNGILQGGLFWNLSQRLRGRLETSIGAHKSVTVGITNALTEKMSMDTSVTGELYGGNIDTSYQLSINRLIFTNCSLGVSYIGNSANDKGFALSINRISESLSTNLNLKYLQETLAVDGKFSMTLDPLTTAKLKFSTSSLIQMSLGFSRNSPDLSNRKYAATLEFGAGFGFGIKLVYSIKDLSFVFPIYICRELSAHSFMLGAGLPSMIGLLLHNLVIQPYKRYIKAQTENNSKKSSHQEYLLQKEQAEISRALMEPFYDRRVNSEISSNGLIIIKATFERASPMGSPLDPPPVDGLDVTIPLQMLISDSHLYLRPHRKSNLIGFYDVAPGCQKLLRIFYKFRGKDHAAIVPDSQELIIPLRDHLILG